MSDAGGSRLRTPTAKTAEFNSCRLFLVGSAKEWSRRPRGSACLVQSDSELLRAFLEGPKNAVWVTNSASRFSVLAQTCRGFSTQRLLVLKAVQEVTHHVLTTWFRHVVIAKAGISLLKPSELLESLAATNANDLFVGGAYDSAGKVVVLYRGTLEPLAIPASWFSEGVGATRVDLSRLDVVDYGQTIRFGDHEVATDAILYEFDEEYRRRAKKREIAVDSSLGGSIRRLRLQKGYTQSDFDLPLKTIARIERGEVRRPQSATLRTIARRLGVSVEALGTY
jgi:hypothetical protein